MSNVGLEEKQMAKQLKIKACMHCGNQIALDAKTCPQCGGKNKKPIYKRTWFIIIVAIFVIGVIGSALNGGDEISQTDTVNNLQTESNKPTETSKPIETTKSDKTTIGQKNALKSAKNYLSFSAFSYKGLIKQLEFEKYTSEEAKYGADNCGADWQEQAAKSAKNYLSFSSFSRDSLIKQLEFDGFTNEQAQYGAKANGY